MTIRLSIDRFEGDKKQIAVLIAERHQAGVLALDRLTATAPDGDAPYPPGFGAGDPVAEPPTICSGAAGHAMLRGSIDPSGSWTL